MKKLWIDLRPIFFLFIAWRLILGVIQLAAPGLFVLREGFLGPTPWVNFDGAHYLSIAGAGYRQYLEAFFPFYPLLIRWGHEITALSPEIVALTISHVAAFVAVVFFYKLSSIHNRKISYWSTVLFLFFPTSFFLVSVYPASLYLALGAACVWCIGKRRWWWAGILGGLASATHIFGVYLIIAAALEFYQSKKRRFVQDGFAIALIPMGLFMYMYYLWKSMGDPLAFFHIQPIFGANRSGGELIFLPQVIWRYVKILFTANPASFSYTIATFEFLSFAFVIYLLVRGWQQKLKFSYLMYSLAVIITPTLTGTLSSFPRYLLAVFPLFFTLETLSGRMKVLTAIMFGLALIYFASAFLQGYFVA